MNDFDYNESDGEEDLTSYPEKTKKITNKFYQATTDYDKAIQYGLDGDNLLNNYIFNGELTQSQAIKIKTSYGTGNKMNNRMDNFFKPEEPKKPLANFSKIVLKGLKALPPRQYILKRLEIERGTLALLCASGASGKSMLLQYIACCASSGKPLFGKFDIAKGTVLHLDQEQNAIQTQRRYERLAAGLELDELDIERVDLNRRLDAPEEIKTVEDDLVALFQGKSLVLIDSLKATSEADENSPQIEVILKIMKRAAEKTKTGIVLIHHKGKSTANVKQSGRGHSSIYDSVDIQIDLDWNMESGTAKLICRKNRDGKLFEGIEYKLLDTGDFNEMQNCSEKLEFQLLSDNIKPEIAVDMQILRALKGKNETLNQKQLFEIVAGDRSIFTDTLERLVSSEYVDMKKGKSNSNNYKITESGLSTLAWNDEESNENKKI